MKKMIIENLIGGVILAIISLVIYGIVVLATINKIFAIIIIAIAIIITLSILFGKIE